MATATRDRFLHAEEDVEIFEREVKDDSVMFGRQNMAINVIRLEAKRVVSDQSWSAKLSWLCRV